MTRALGILLLASAAACSHSGAPAAAAVSGDQRLKVIDAGVVITGADPVDAGAPDAGSADDVLAVLERTPCFGRCPVYGVSVHRDGRVEYEGRRFVGQVGRVSAQLTPAQLDDLVQAFHAANFFALEHQKASRHTTDLPGAVLTFHENGQARTIRDDHGDPGWPQALRALEDRIDEIVGTSRWVKGTE